MRMLRALSLLVESVFALLSLTVQQKIRKVKKNMKKQKEEQKSKPLSPEQAPALKIKISKAQKISPPFPDQKPAADPEAKKIDAEGSLAGSRISLIDEPVGPDPREVATAGAILDIPFRGAHLVWKDVEPLSKDEIAYMAEPLAEVFADLGWSEKLKVTGPYVKLGWGLTLAVVSRMRAHEAIRAAQKKAAEKEASKAAAAPGSAGTMTPGLV